MSKCVSHREFIPMSNSPAEMPEGIAVKYCIHQFGPAFEITPDSLKRILKKLRSGAWANLYLSNDDSLEQDFMVLESGGGLFALQYLKDNSGSSGEEAAWWSTYDPDYLDSDAETDIEPSDGQSIIFREFTTANQEPVMTAIEYFIRTGTLWDGISWMKCWQEWV